MSPPTNHVPIKQQQSCRPVSPGGITFFSCCRCWQGLKWCHILHRNGEPDFQRSIPGDLFTVTLAASLGQRKQQTFEPKVMSRAHEQHCGFLSVTHKSQDLGLCLWDEHLKMLELLTCWVLSIIARASAISFWLTPQRFATFVWHLWWTFMPHAERKNRRCQDNEGCKRLGRNVHWCWPGAEFNHLKV